jgi:prepilin-type N-terminal cleavage/methylation domain-containing protein
MTRSGFSLLEMLIVFALVLVMAGAALLLRVSGQQQSVAIEFRAAALQSAQLVLTRLERDVSSLVPGPLDAAAGPMSGPSVSLTRVRDASDAQGLPLDRDRRLLTERVTWAFDAGTGTLARNGEPLRAVRMHAVQFTYFPTRPGDTAPPYGDTLAVRMVFVPPETIGRVGPDTPRVEFVTAFHAPQGTLDHVHPEWVGDR